MVLKKRIQFVIILFGILVLAGTTVSAQVPGYDFRLKYAVQSAQVSGTTGLTDFPVLFSITDLNLRTTANGGNVENANGYDIVFTTSNGSTLLEHQIESYNGATGEFIAWVRFPTVTGASDTEFYVYYGNSSVSVDPSVTSVWDSNYQLIMHLNGNLTDQSGTGNDGTDNGPTTSIAGQIGNGRDFDNTDFISIADDPTLNITGELTISMWYNPDDVSNAPDLVTNGAFGESYSTWARTDATLRMSTNGGATLTTPGTVTLSSWNYLTFVQTSTGREIYIDGALSQSDATTTAYDVVNSPITISTSAFPINGQVDEVRISNALRSSDWIATEYNNQNAPGTFIQATNTEPSLDNIEASVLTFNSGDAPVALTSALDVVDEDDTNMESATVSITSNYTSSEDTLIFADQNGITGSFNNSNGVLTLTGSASKANYQTALRSITYQNSDVNPTENTRVITFTVNDGTDNSTNSPTRSVTVVRVNNAPVLADIESSSATFVASGSPIKITSALSITDFDDLNMESATVQVTGNYLSSEDVLAFSDQLGITGSFNSLNGTLTLSGTASLADYEAAFRDVTYENTNGTPSLLPRTITFTVNDGDANSNTQTRDIELSEAITDLSSYLADVVFHYDALDIDGDLATNDQPADASTVATWGDRSDDALGSGTDLSATTGTASDEPTFSSVYFGERGALEWDGTNDALAPPNNAILNTGSFTEKSFAIVFRTGDSVAGLQMLYEQGGGTRGYQISLKDGNAYAFVWNNSEWGAGDQYKSIDLGAVVPNTSYIILASHDATDALLDNRVWEGNINGGSIQTLTRVDTQQSHGGGALIGEENGTRDPVTTGNNPGGTNNFGGFIAEFISWNTALSGSDFTNIFGNLQAKWFNVPSDLMDIETSDLVFTEGDAATAVTSALTVSDSDNTLLDSAKVAITAGFNPSEDVLAFSNQLGITGAFDSGTGVLTLSGTTSIANYQTAIRAVTYQNTDGVDPDTTTRVLTFSVFDWDDESNQLTRNIDINKINSITVLSAIEGPNLAYTEGDGPVVITSTLAIADLDDTNLESATVSISNNYFLGEDFLSFTDAFGITGSFNSGTGVLTLSGTSSLANYQSALRSVTYENNSADPVTGLDRTISFITNDGDDDSNTLTRDVTVTRVNTAPTLADIETEALLFNTNDPATEITSLITVTDPDDINIESATIQITGNYNTTQDTLTYADIFGITGSWTDGTGTLSLSGSASLADYEIALQTVKYQNLSSNPSSPQRTVSFSVNDGDATSNILTRDITVSVPAAISNLLFWLKADAGTFFDTPGSNAATSDGDSLLRWEDQSGNNRHFFSTGTDDEPTLRTGVGALNGQAALEFPGNLEVRMEDADGELYLNGLTEFTFFFVIKSDVTNSDKGFWLGYPPDGTGLDQFFGIRYDAAGLIGSGTNLIKTAIRENIASNELESFSDVQTTNGQIVMVKWQDADNYELYVDGVLNNPAAQGAVPTGALANLTSAIVGQGSKDTGESWDGLIAEVVAYGRDLPESERVSVEDYLSARYDIPIRLITKATGGEAISADNTSSTFTTLSGPRIQEGFLGQLAQNGTIVLEAPSGYEWDTGGAVPSLSVLPAFGGSTNLAASFTSRTTSQVTFTISQASTSPNNPGELTISGLRVRPTSGIVPNTGIITNSGTTGSGGTTNYGDLAIVPGTRISMEFSQQPSNSNVSTNIIPAVRVQLIDQFGNAVQDSDIDISIALTTGSGSLSGTSPIRTNALGIAEFSDLSIDETGTKELTASSTGLTDITSDPFDIVNAGVLTAFRVERQPSGSISSKTAGQAFNLTLTAIDGVGSTIPSFTGTVSISSTCNLGTGSGTTANFVSGVLSPYTVSITNTGNCTITATNSAGSETGTSNSFLVTPGAASDSTSIITAAPTVILNDGSSTSTITVQLKDAQGNDLTVGGETVALSTDLGSIGGVTDNTDGTYTATLTSSTFAGIATVSGTLNTIAIQDSASVEYAAFSHIWQSQLGIPSVANDWDIGANWSSGTIPSASSIVLIPANPSVGNEFPVVDVNNTTITDLAIEAGAQVTVSGSANFIITGDLRGDGNVLGTNNDTLTVGGALDVPSITLGNVALNGAAKQVIDSPHSYTNLEIDNSAGVDATENLTVSGILELTDGELLIPSGVNLIANSKTVGSGSLRFQRLITGARGWRMVSAPVNSTFGDFLDGTLTQGYTGSTLGNAPLDSLQPNVLFYDETFPGTDNQRYRAPGNSTDNLTAGQGMFVFFFGDIAADSRYNNPLPDTLDVTGQEFEGSGTEVDFGVTYTALADTGWNLVGNPYGATIDWDHPSWTKTNIESTIYIWDPAANGGNGEYLTWNGTTGTLGNGLIAPFQGFWVKASATSPSLIVSENAKTTGGNFLRKAQPAQSTGPVITLELTGEGLSKQMNVMLSSGANVNKDPFDAFEITPFSLNRLEIFSMLTDGTPLAINNLPMDFENRYRIPIEVRGYQNGVPLSGTFQIKPLGLKRIPDEYVLILVDNETGEEIDLREAESYQFNHTTSERFKMGSPDNRNKLVAQQEETRGRFTLIISTEEIEATIPRDFYLNQNYPNPFNPSTTIEFGLTEVADVRLDVYDILGRRVETLLRENRPAGNYRVVFQANGLASGLYLYRLQVNDRVFVEKMTLIK
ncbi:MAG: DUF2341 domain-containing protein [Bacteroidota bacterium]